MARCFGGLAVGALILAGLAAPAGARGFGGHGSFDHRGAFFDHRGFDHRGVFFAHRGPFFFHSPFFFRGGIVVGGFGYPYPYYPYYYYPYAYPYAVYGSYAPPVAMDAADPGTVTPQAAAKRNCRAVQTTVTVDGRRQPVRGQACQWLDGTWHLVP